MRTFLRESDRKHRCLLLNEGDTFGEGFVPLSDFKGIKLQKVWPDGVELKLMLSSSQTQDVRLEFGKEWISGRASWPGDNHNNKNRSSLIKASACVSPYGDNMT
jgi:hypothetical protein